MSREILFRGKTKNCKYRKNGKWIYGFYEKKGDRHIIVITTRESLGFGLEVDEETIGEYIGRKDKHIKKVFVGDILHIKVGHGSCVVGKAIVYFDEQLLQYRVRELKPYAYDSEVGDEYRECDFEHIDDFEIIGNIFDNKELLGE